MLPAQWVMPAKFNAICCWLTILRPSISQTSIQEKKEKKQIHIRE